MNTEPDKAKRWWRPRFTVRTLVVLVTLICAYLACWGPTQDQGIVDVARRILRESPPIGWEHCDFVDRLDPSSPIPLVVGVYRSNYTRREYYVWFFGFTARLPYSQSLPLAPPMQFPIDEDMLAEEAESKEDHPR